MLERPAFLVLQVALISQHHVICPVCVQIVSTPAPGAPTPGFLMTETEARRHWEAGHFDRRPLDTSTLPPARRIVERGSA